MELYRKYRPTRFRDIKGQTEAVTELENMLKNNTVPHALLLSGPSGVGKTTIGRILQKKLKCGDKDYVELDCATVEKPMDTVRSIRQATGMHCWPGSSCKIWFLEEIGTLARATFAQQALLKMLEDIPDNVYFIAATTDPEKILKAVRSRFRPIVLRPLASLVLNALLEEVLAKENKSLDQEVIDAVVEAADGSARVALVLLEKALAHETKEQQLEAIVKSDQKRKAFEIIQALLYRRVKNFSEMTPILAGIEEDPEGLRQYILACATTELLKGNRNAPRAAKIISYFKSPYHYVGRAGLVLNCFEVIYEPD